MAEAMARCELTDLLARECAHCRRIPDPEPIGPLLGGRVLTARYDGRCYACGHPYQCGDKIRRITDDDGSGYLGPCCREDDRG